MRTATSVLVYIIGIIFTYLVLATIVCFVQDTVNTDIFKNDIFKVVFMWLTYFVYMGLRAIVLRIVTGIDPG